VSAVQAGGCVFPGLLASFPGFRQPDVGINAERDTPLLAGHPILEAPPFAARGSDFEVHASAVGKSPRFRTRLCVLDQ